MSSCRYTRRTRRAAAPSAALPAMRLTRRTLPQGPGAELLGRPIMCPIDFCNTYVPPSFASDGTVEYRCYVGRHGQIGRIVNGRVELTVRTFVDPRRLLPNRTRCSVPGCSLVRNATCGRGCCLQHCLENEASCNGYAHDYARALRLVSVPLHAANVEPGTPLFFPATPTPEPECTPPSSPVPGVDYDPEVAYVQLGFLDRDLTVEAVCTMAFDTVDLALQDVRVRDTLHVHQIRPGSLEYLGADNDWHRAPGHVVPARYGQVFLRALSVGHTRNFPPTHFIDMAPRVDRFYNLLDRNVTPDRAFESVFACTPTQADHESLELCREVLERSPKHLRDSFTAAGRTPQGTWADFIHSCVSVPDKTPTKPRARSPPPDKPSSPILARHRAIWRGPSPSEAGPSRPFTQNASPPPMIIGSDSD